MPRPVAPISSLPLRTVVEAGKLFKTGEPVIFTFIRNTEPAPRPRRWLPDQFQQRIEPHGMFMLHDEVGGRLQSGWIRGTVSFESPIVLALNRGSGGLYDDNSWKAVLSKHFRARGKKLTDAILNAGYDGIVTVGDGPSTSEIVALDPRRSVSVRATKPQRRANHPLLRTLLAAGV